MRQTPGFVAFRVVFRRAALATVTGLAVIAAGGGWASAGDHGAGRPRAARPLVTASRVTASRVTAAPAYFHTLRPGAKLPTGTQCAKWVRARPAVENKGMN